MMYFKTMELGNPIDLTAPKKFYARATKTKELNLRELAKEISFSTTATTIDVMAILESLIQLLPKHLTDGKRINLGDFGSFRATLSSRGETTAEEVTRHSIKGINVIFRPGKELRDQLDHTKFKKEE